MAFDPRKCNFRRLGTITADMGALVPRGTVLRGFRDTLGSGTLKIRVMSRDVKGGKATRVETFYLDKRGKRL
jgi:hypothetical protein